MRAVFIAVGSELLEQNRVDTNSIYMAEKLFEKGILTDMKMVVGDNRDYLSWAIRQGYKRAQLLIITGGLGPTVDDITREAVAAALRRELEYQQPLVDKIRAIFSRQGMDMPENNTRQGFVIEGAEVLPNPVGTAPGQYIDDENCRVLLLPGPPRELKPMFDDVLERRISSLSNYHVYKRVIKFAGITESEADSRVMEIAGGIRNPVITILASPGFIELHLMGRSRKSVEEAVEPTDMLAKKISEAMNPYVVTEKNEKFEQVILRMLRERHMTLALGESCTGGGLSNRLTDIPGSSEVFLGGIVAYDNSVKRKLLGVRADTLETYGAVSQETAAEMARGARDVTGADIALSITGIAGPGGGRVGKPVGLVFFHISAQNMEMNRYRVFTGDRNLIKIRSENFAMNLLREFLNANG